MLHALCKICIANVTQAPFTKLAIGIPCSNEIYIRDKTDIHWIICLVGLTAELGSAEKTKILAPAGDDNPIWPA
jgi:hypothetical protein